MKRRKETNTQELRRLIVQLSQISVLVDSEDIESFAHMADAAEYLKRALSNDDDNGDFLKAEQECAVEEVGEMLHDCFIFRMDAIRDAFINASNRWMALDEECPNCTTEYVSRFAQLWTKFLEDWKALKTEYHEQCQHEIDGLNSGEIRETL